jgi:hypothetical protein
MARCAQCGNDYDKTFEITLGGRTMSSTHSNAPFRCRRRSARIAAAASSGTASSITAKSFAARTAPDMKA